MHGSQASPQDTLGKSLLLLWTALVVGCSFDGSTALHVTANDGSTADALVVDAANGPTPDASPLDASLMDASLMDASPLDASLMDADSTDAAPSDASPDASVILGYRHELGFSYTPASADLVDLPVLVVLDSSRVDYSLIAAGGADLRFTDATTATTLPHEIELWNAAGLSYVWVKVPLLGTSGTDTIWMHYGEPAAANWQDANAVWNDGFRAVWHLGEIVEDEESSAEAHRDSTIGGNHADHSGNVNTQGPGTIGRAQSFDGSDDRVSVSSTGLQIIGKAITISARVKLTGTPNDFPHVYGAGADGRYWQIFWYTDGASWANRFRMEGNQYTDFTAPGALDAWVSLSSVYDGVALRMYVDGVEVRTVPVSFSAAFAPVLDALTTDFYIGDNPSLDPREFEGEIDEVRISDVARSSEWIMAEHLSSVDSLVVFGAREAL